MFDTVAVYRHCFMWLSTVAITEIWVNFNLQWCLKGEVTAFFTIPQSFKLFHMKHWHETFIKLFVVINTGKLFVLLITGSSAEMVCELHLGKKYNSLSGITVILCVYCFIPEHG